MMNADLLNNGKLLREYEEVFDNEEKIMNTLKITSDSFTRNPCVVKFADVSISAPIKQSRKETYLGLSKQVAEMGILDPIDVMQTEGYSDWLESGETGDYPGHKYVVIDGVRRVYAGIKNGLSQCNALVWEFKDKEQGSKLLFPLRMVLNKRAKHSWKEIWGDMQMLEIEYAASPGTLDYMLQLEPGESIKLKAIMQCEYQEVVDELLSGKKNLSQCYSMLQKLLKEEDQLLNEDRKGISEVEGTKGLISEDEERKTLSDQEVHEILEMDDSFNGELSEGDFNGSINTVERQDPKHRHPLDETLRKNVLSRDNYSCQAGGMGMDKGYPFEVVAGVLHVHHLVPVYLGGTDTEDNLITVDLMNHTLIHIIEQNDGRLPMTKEEFEALPNEEKVRIKKVMQIARYAVEARRRAGRSKESIKKESKAGARFEMPGTDLRKNVSAVNS